jgi:hypothetical protein
MAKIESPQTLLGISGHGSRISTLGVKDIVVATHIGCSQQLALRTLLDSRATASRSISHRSEGHSIIRTHGVETGGGSAGQPGSVIRVKSTRIIQIHTSELSTSTFGLPPASPIINVSAFAITSADGWPAVSLRTILRGATGTRYLQRSSKAGLRETADNRGTVTTRARRLRVHRTIRLVGGHVKDIVGVIHHARGRKRKHKCLQSIEMGSRNLLELVREGELVGIIKLEGIDSRVGQTLEIREPGLLPETQVGIKIRINSDITGDGGATQGGMLFTTVQGGANVDLHITERPAQILISLHGHDRHMIMTPRSEKHRLHTETHVPGERFGFGRLIRVVVPTKLLSPVLHNGHVFVIISSPNIIRVLSVTDDVVVQRTKVVVVDIALVHRFRVKNSENPVVIDKLGVLSEVLTRSRPHDVDDPTIPRIRRNKLVPHVRSLGTSISKDFGGIPIRVTERNKATIVVTRVNAGHPGFQIVNSSGIIIYIVGAVGETARNTRVVLDLQFEISALRHIQNNIFKIKSTMVPTSHLVILFTRIPEIGRAHV